MDFSRLLKLDDEELVQDRLRLFRRDYNYRNSQVNIDEAFELYEEDSTSHEDTSIPKRNLIARAVDDLHAVAITSLPKVHMKADFIIDRKLSYLEKYLQELVVQNTERVIDSYLKTLLRQSNFETYRDTAIKQAAIAGVGYLGLFIDSTINTRSNKRLRRLLFKGFEDFESADADFYNLAAKKITVKHFDSRQVYWHYGIYKVDEHMYRVSVLEQGDVFALRKLYNNELIKAGDTPWGLIDPIEGNGVSTGGDNTRVNNITTILHTWEIEPYIVNKKITTKDPETGKKKELNMKFTDNVLLYTKIVGGELIEKKAVAVIPDESKNIEQGVPELPIVPIYLKESETHPYGISLPLRYKTRQDYINRMYLVMYRAARRSALPNGLLIFDALLGSNDLNQIMKVLEDGGVGVVTGNDMLHGDPDIRKMLVTLNHTQTQLPVAMMESVRMEEAAFKQESSSVDMDAINNARTGTAKQTQIAISDRPKTASISLLARGLRNFYNLVFDYIQTYHSNEIVVNVDTPDGARKSITLNQTYERSLAKLDDNGRLVTSPELISPDNELGIEFIDVKIVVNSTATDMIAQTDDMLEIPTDPRSRFQLVAGWAQLGLFKSPETVRELVLPEYIKSMDDGFAEESAKEQAALAAQQQQQPQIESSVVEGEGKMSDNINVRNTATNEILRDLAGQSNIFI